MIRKLRRKNRGRGKGRRELDLERKPRGKWRNQPIDQAKPEKDHQDVTGQQWKMDGDTPHRLSRV